MTKATGTATGGGQATGGKGTLGDSNRSRGSAGSEGAAARDTRDVGAGYLCTFTVGGQRYALSTSLVRELVEVTSVTRVPRVDTTLIGLFNLRGEPMPLVDLALVLGLSPIEPSAKMSVIIIRGEDMSLGARIDALGTVVANAGVIATADPNPLLRGFLPATSTDRNEREANKRSALGVSEGPIAVINPGEFMMRLERLKFGTGETSKGVTG